MTNRLPDLADLLESWELELRSTNKSRHTIRAYVTGVKQYLQWCRSAAPQLSKSSVTAFIAELLADGAEPATARNRHMALRRFSAWLTDEGELDADPLLGVKPPKLNTKITAALTDDELRSLIAACRGKAFLDRRDDAVVRLMSEGALRSAELVGMSVDDIDLKRCLAIVRKGKGGKGRVVPFGPQTAAAVDRYLRVRRGHRLASSGQLWLGGGGQTFSYHGLARAMSIRAELAGIKGFHLHLLRSTAATRWLRAGGSEGGLMAVAGWSTRSMIDRYTAATASERAADESRKLDLGNI